MNNDRITKAKASGVRYRRFLAQLLDKATPLAKGLNIMVRPKPEPTAKIIAPNDDHLTDTEKLDRWKLYKQTPAYLRDLVWLSSQGKGV